MNTRLIDALHCRNQSRPPVWLMRQAGRYMPEFRKLRQRYDFMTICRNPELATQVTLLPIDLLDPDAAILFSDILVVLDAMDRGLHFEKGVGPIIDRPVSTAADVEALPMPDVNETLGYVADAIKLLRTKLQVPLIGFCGAPYTVASYLIEGASSRDLRKTKQWLFQNPQSFHALLEHLTQLTIRYCQMQIEAGAQAIQVFDSWANTLAYREFMQFSLPYLQRIVDALRPTGVPVILFAKGSSVFADELATVAPAALSIDWNVHLPTLAQKMPAGIALQGNIDPDLLYASEATITKETQRLLQQMQGNPGFIVNLGHGLKPDMEPEKVRCLVDAVREFSPIPVG